MNGSPAPEAEQLTGYPTAEQALACVEPWTEATRRAERERCRAKATAILPTLRKAAWALDTEVDEAQVYASADAYARRIVPTTRARTVPCVGRRARPRGRRPGHRRPSSTRAGPSDESDSDEPGEAGNRRRAVVVDDRYLVVGLVVA